MTDEKIIYLGPEEDLTSVSERLEKTNAGRITLVIPPQTQLRSLVGWRVLHARMRELGKDVLVISPERQIRAVAKAAGFRAADSLESPPSAKTRPSSHPSRSGTGGKTPQRLRNLPGRGSPENRAHDSTSSRTSRVWRPMTGNKCNKRSARRAVACLARMRCLAGLIRVLLHPPMVDRTRNFVHPRICTSIRLPPYVHTCLDKKTMKWTH